MPPKLGAGTSWASMRSNKSDISPKSNIQIEIENHFDSKVYTSGSTLRGQAIVKLRKETPFDDFDIVFSGIAATKLVYVQQYPSRSFRPFLKLVMPIDRSSMPETLVFASGKTYKIPFNFILPHQLTIDACNHPCTIPAVKDQHLRLPPTFGFWESDDQAPKMAGIEYSIKASIYRKATQAGQAPDKLIEGCHIIRVIPSFPEDAPLHITPRDERYRMSKTKRVRKNLSVVKAGELTVTASQPSAVMLSADGCQASSSVARLELEFCSTSAETPPPQIHSVSGKITSSTFFGAAPSDLLPNLGSRAALAPNLSLSYSATNAVFKNHIAAKLAWQMRNLSTRQNSGYSGLRITDRIQWTRNCFNDATEMRKNRPIRHHAIMEIPFNVPISRRKIFLPTFHSCLISRTYTLHLNLSAGTTSTGMSLAIPLQIGVEAIYAPQDSGLPSFKSVMGENYEAMEASSCTPRITRIFELRDQTNSILPTYDEISRRIVRTE